MHAHFNKTLFTGELPADVIVTITRERRVRGVFRAIAWTDATTRLPEIALAPAAFAGRTRALIASTFVHEQTHLWQWCFGKPGLRGYHNKEWADRMTALGLEPSSTGEPGGERTGRAVSHYVIEGGPFTDAFAAMPPDLWLPFEPLKDTRTSEKRARNDGKLAFVCACGDRFWAKASLRAECVVCGSLFSPLEPP